MRNHQTGDYVSYSSLTVCGFFNVPQCHVRRGLSSLTKKTRGSNFLQMSTQRHHFVVSYLKTLSVGPAGVFDPATSPAQYSDDQPVSGSLVRSLSPDDLKGDGCMCTHFSFSVASPYFSSLLPTFRLQPQPLPSHFKSKVKTNGPPTSLVLPFRAGKSGGR